MSTELIERILIRSGDVYLSSKSRNDDQPFHEWKCTGLTEVYHAEGQPGLDREVLRMLGEYAALHGTHPTLERYRYALDAPRAKALHQEYLRSLEQAYSALDDQDRKTFWTEPSVRVRAFRQLERDQATRRYAEQAKLCREYDKLQEGH